MHLLFGLFLVPFGVIHFLPTIIAAFRDSRSVVGIFLLNLFLSWTVIGWFVALTVGLHQRAEVAVLRVPAAAGTVLESSSRMFRWD